MEIGRETLSGIQLAGNDSLVDAQCFHAMIQDVLQLHSCKSSERLRTAVEKKASFALTSFITDCVRLNTSLDEIKAILEESKFDAERAKIFLSAYKEHKDSVRDRLTRISSFGRAKIVDVDWRLDYNIKSSQSEKINQLSYLVNIHTQEPGESEQKIISFNCSLEQLQDLVGKLKDAVRCVEKQVST